MAKKDVPVEVFWKNKLPKGEHLLPVDFTIHTADPIRKALEKGYIPTVTHLHGGHTESASDGIPEAWFAQGFSGKGAQWTKGIYRYDNDQQAATLWYHDNALGLTRLNVYAGLAGFYLLRDDNENRLTTTGVLPRAPYEIEMVVQDKIFTSDGKLFLPSRPKIEVPAQPFMGGPSIIAEF
ncbi:MAG: multicopper oxidase domain-containing protein, partial [Waddliaceae bacterium]